jgi:hypothetical protein
MKSVSILDNPGKMINLAMYPGNDITQVKISQK